MKALKEETAKAVREVLEEACLNKGDIFVVGCSTSEVMGGRIGKNSSMEAASYIYEALDEELRKKEVFLAVQCCEHLNRAIVIERDALLNLDQRVNVVPHEHAGGSLATTAYSHMKSPVVVETIVADAGLDIGDTLIGMHLRRVAVPLRIPTKTIGEAHILGARTRPKFIGGNRAEYDSKLAKGK